MSVYITGDNIVSSLGFTTEENIAAVKREISGLWHYADCLGMSEPFVASVVDDRRLAEVMASTGKETGIYTRFEQIAIASVWEAARQSGADLADSRTLFILSTTKGNIELLDKQHRGRFDSDRLYLWRSAQLIASFFGNRNEPLVVSNACISGVVAQIVAKRWMESGLYRRVVVIGADVLSKFVVSGFQSFKALSPEPCRPFDASRCGLNIGEGAATLIFECATGASDKVMLEAGAMTNDANHISGPSRTGEGLYLALREVMKGVDASEIGFLNAHGTATPYNDEMEAIAFGRAGLQEVPVYSLKGYFGHTLGAAGVVETVVAARGLRENFLPACKGYESCGVSVPLQVVVRPEQRLVGRCIKTASGFGGCNAAIRLGIEN